MYLLDSNICIYYLKPRYGLDRKLNAVGIAQCHISEITVAELKFGAEKSVDPSRNRLVLNEFLVKFEILPIFPCLDIYAREKARLQKAGSIIDDFDLLIGATAIANDLILVTNNEKHFARLDGIRIENWIR